MADQEMDQKSLAKEYRANWIAEEAKRILAESALATAQRALREIARFAEDRAAKERARIKIPGEWMGSWGAVAHDARAALAGKSGKSGGDRERELEDALVRLLETQTWSFSDEQAAAIDHACDNVLHRRIEPKESAGKSREKALRQIASCACQTGLKYCGCVTCIARAALK
jgi:hypothetical protein